MRYKKEEDIIDWRGERAKKIIKAFKKIEFNFILVSDKEYNLGPYEIIRLVNIFATSNRVRRGLESFEKLIKRRDKGYELPDWTKPKGGLNI
ncbi:hypothetical protein ES705_49671 [subsurface metagenome]